MFDCFRSVSAMFVGIKGRTPDLNAFALDGGGLVVFDADDRWFEDELDIAYAPMVEVPLV